MIGPRSAPTSEPSARVILKQCIQQNLRYLIARPGEGSFPATTGTSRWPHAVRDGMVASWINAGEGCHPRPGTRIVSYLVRRVPSGPHLGNNLLNLGDERRRGRRSPELGQDLDRVLDQEEEPGLGNGGLGRLAACYMDSLATLGGPGHRLRHPLRIRHLRPDRSSTAGRWRSPTSGSGSAIRGRSPVPRLATTSGSAATERYDDPGRHAREWIPARGEGRRLRHAYPRLPRQPRQPASPLESRGRRVFRLPGFNLGDYYRAVDDKVKSREHHQSTLSERRDRSQGKSFDWSSSTSSCPARCRT